jgi:hypothetical protein
MIDRSVSKTLWRIFPDVLVGLSVFVLTLVLTLGDAPMAAPYTSTHDFLAGAISPGLDDRHGAFFLLAAAFGAIVTLDLAFLRHVLCTYASPRGAARRGAQRSESEKSS